MKSPSRIEAKLNSLENFLHKTGIRDASGKSCHSADENPSPAHREQGFAMLLNRQTGQLLQLGHLSGQTRKPSAFAMEPNQLGQPADRRRDLLQVKIVEIEMRESEFSCFVDPAFGF